MLIYRDGHAEEVENYAIVGKTIWVFNEARAKKIPLADLDLPADQTGQRGSWHRLRAAELLSLISPLAKASSSGHWGRIRRQQWADQRINDPFPSGRL